MNARSERNARPWTKRRAPSGAERYRWTARLSAPLVREPGTLRNAPADRAVERGADERVGEEREIGLALGEDRIDPPELGVDVAGVRADLAQPAVGREERQAGRIQAWSAAGEVDGPDVARHAAVRERAHERRGVDRGALHPGPARRGAAAHPAHEIGRAHV